MCMPHGKQLCNLNGMLISNNTICYFVLSAQASGPKKEQEIQLYFISNRSFFMGNNLLRKKKQQ